jgi:hypothetical protein
MQRGSVVQLKGKWNGCFAIVGEVTNWGLKVSLLTPDFDGAVGFVPMRLTPDQFHDLGVVAPIVPSEVYGGEAT